MSFDFFSSIILVLCLNARVIVKKWDITPPTSDRKFVVFLFLLFDGL